jgi:hypothetical protein
MFAIADRLDELRCWPTDRLVSRRDELIGVQRRARVEELAIVRILDERGRMDPTLERSRRIGADGARHGRDRAAVGVAAGTSPPRRTREI